MGGFSSAWPCVVVGRGWPSVLVASSGSRVGSDRRGSRVVGQTSLSSTLPPSHWAIDYTNETQKSPASPPHALPLDQPHFSPFVVINNGGIDWIYGFYFFGFLGFIFLVFLGFNFLVSGFYFSGFHFFGFLGFILRVDWVGLNVMVVGLW